MFERNLMSSCSRHEMTRNNLLLRSNIQRVFKNYIVVATDDSKIFHHTYCIPILRQSNSVLNRILTMFIKQQREKTKAQINKRFSHLPKRIKTRKNNERRDSCSCQRQKNAKPYQGSKEDTHNQVCIP